MSHFFSEKSNTLFGEINTSNKTSQFFVEKYKLEEHFLYSFRRNKKTVKDQSRQKAVPIKCKSDAGVTWNFK